MSLIICKLVVLFTILELISCNGYFTIIGSKLIRQNAKYRVAITCFGQSDGSELEVAIRNSEINWETVQNVTLISGKNQMLEFDLRDQPVGNYALEARTFGAEQSKHVVKLNMNTKKLSTFVQTDKAIYKPADNVQFRVLVLDADLKSLNKDNVQIHITDGAQNRVKQFDDIVLTKGLFQSEFKLSDLPVLGNWHLHVTVDNQNVATKEFEVAEYTLPNFEVKLDVNSDANFGERKIRATVTAKYTFGKVAKGNATVTAEVETRSYWYMQPENVKVSKSVEVGGKKAVEFDIEDELGIKMKGSERTVKLFATFKEELTGREQNATAKVQIHITPHQIEMEKGSAKFKPGLPFAVTALLKYHDKNAPVTDMSTPVDFTIKFYYDKIKTCQRSTYPGYYFFNRQTENYKCRDELSYEKVMKVYPSNGISKIDIEPSLNITRMDIEAKYFETVKSIKNIQRSESESNQYIKIKSKVNRAKLSQKIAIKVLSTNNISEITYYVLSKGAVVASETVTFSTVPPTKINEFEFTPTFAMIPKAKVLAFYITNDGEIISDSLELEFDNELRNFIDIQLSENQVKPGGPVNISITSNPNSIIGLLGVDQSVLVLKKGNDIEESTVFQELEQYSKANKLNNNWYASTNQIYTDFQNLEVVIITNAKKEHQPQSIPIDYGDVGDFSYRYYNDGIDRYQHNAMPLMMNSFPSMAHSSGMMGRSQYLSGSSSMQNSISSGISLNNAFSSSSASSHQESLEEPANEPTELIEVRKTFPETWLFENLNFDFNQTNSILSIQNVPDTITSWIITGFSIDPITGLGLTKQPSKLNIFQPFFVSMNLPYSIKRREVISIPITVFNYMDTDQTAAVTFYNEEGEFEFTEVKDYNNLDELKGRTSQTPKTKNISVKSQSGTTVSFMIRPLNVGHIKIKIIARSTIAGDGAERQLIVEPEGVTQYMNDAVFIDLRNNQEFKSNISINVPSNAVPDSTRIEASATGDLLGPSIDNLDKLIKLPYGCGEQNMLNFVPNIVVLDYLTAVNKLTPEIKSKAKTFLESGYQRELTYKHDDGSYSIWGKSDKSGSTWLTAFVAKSFHQAAKYISIDKDIIKQALNFLSSTQADNGSFPEVGYVYQKDIQGGSSNGIALTAYTLITFLEYEDFLETFKTTIEKGLTYLEQNYGDVNDSYSLAIASYTLQLANHISKDFLISKLDNQAIQKDGTMHWEKVVPESNEKNNYWSPKPSSVNVEMSSYALQAFIGAGRLTESVKIMKWLVTQRNENGGFHSTQDTIVGIQALARLAAKIYAPNSTIDIIVKPNTMEATTLHVNEQNALILQKYELPSIAKDFEIIATGHGFGIFQLSYRYNIDTSPKGPRFILNAEVNEKSNKEFLHLKVCTSFIPDALTDKSNMVVMEVAFPSGFTFDTDSFPELEAIEEVKKVETKDRETIVIVYFDDLSSKSVCPEFIALRTHSVAEQKPAAIVIYDYYDTSRHALTFYNPPGISICDICNGDEECIDELDCKDADVTIV